MSADLWAEFGAGTSQSSTDTKAVAQASQTANVPAWDDSDPFGPLVSAEPSQETSSAAQGHNVDRTSGTGDDLWHRDNSGAQVLFDAAMEEPPADEEEWGDFETAVEDPKADGGGLGKPKAGNNISKRDDQSSVPTGTLLDLSLDDGPTQTGQGKVVARDVPRSQIRFGATSAITTSKPSRSVSKTPTKSTGKSQKMSQEDDFFDNWDDFDASEGALPAATGQQSKSTTAAPAMSINRSQEPEPEVRPLNIPPPSILLQLIPGRIEHFHTQGSQKWRDQQPGSPDLASQILRTLKVTARIIAGRTLRWKRDPFLAQSMKIGPARSGRSGGMKLSSLNKSESIKEEQEVAIVLDLWRRHLSSLNSVVQAAGQRPIPVVQDKTRVDTAGPSQGALQAPHACALCGLKRDERLPKIDEHVEDSFGEWWSEHWGHTDCKWFWTEYSQYLSQR
ncbi:hypothetical protein VTN49DRAFT_1841 [Thermomyces lanuginosus]|uniref:uncharacterized protein n=1 Tax=Thermomyces lanuginosus TaxID=5541 RepID=UPI00374427AA